MINRIQHRIFHILCRRRQILSGFVAAFALLWMLSQSGQALAHPLNNGYSDLFVKGSEIQYELFLPEKDLLKFDGDKDGTLSDGELAAGRPAIERFLAGGMSITAGGQNLTFVLDSMKKEQRETISGVTFSLRFVGQREIAGFKLKYNLLFDDVDPYHISFLMVTENGDTDQTVLEESDRSYTFVPLDTGLKLSVLKRYLLLGIFHIWTGYDHLLFVLSLILVALNTREILRIVTAFTAAHSITLFLAATGRLDVSPRWVEASIALTICYVALENVWLTRTGWRWGLAFVFGLVHGLGFAGALAEIGLPEQHLLASVLSFNVGVELGQLSVVAVVFPVILYIRRRPWYPKAMKGASLAIFAVGFIWLVQRLIV